MCATSVSIQELSNNTFVIRCVDNCFFFFFFCCSECFKGRVQCFSMQIMKCFLLNLKKNMVSESLTLSLPVNSFFTDYSSSLAFDSVTSFFRIKGCSFCVIHENDKTDLRKFFSFQGLVENTCLLQLALKSTALGLLAFLYTAKITTLMNCLLFSRGCVA